MPSTDFPGLPNHLKRSIFELQALLSLFYEEFLKILILYISPASVKHYLFMPKKNGVSGL